MPSAASIWSAAGLGWVFRTAPDLAAALSRAGEVVQRKLSRAALETLAIIAYHQPVTRAEIEDIRGRRPGKGTLDLLFEAGVGKMQGRGETPGTRPTCYGQRPRASSIISASPAVGDLPEIGRIEGSGLLDPNPPAGAET